MRHVEQLLADIKTWIKLETDPSVSKDYYRMFARRLEKAIKKDKTEGRLK